jgi:rhamnulose-1-phosphate aldolase/alcohol dehydrogenase
MSTTTPHLVSLADDLWPTDPSEVPSDPLGQVVLASHLLGANRAVANIGGGNTSAKGTATDHTGREVRAMWVKGSGSDLATMTEANFTGLKLDDLLPLMDRPEMVDEEMVAYVGRSMLDPAMPRGSIETLLHAFIPADHVHHTHPDGINVIAGAKNGEALIAECFGDRAIWVPYIRPGFTLAKQIGEAVRDNPAAELVVLGKHGLVVWGDTAEDTYRRTISIINEGAAFMNEKAAGAVRFGGVAPEASALDAAGRQAVLDLVLPSLRGAVSSERAKVLLVDSSAPAIEFVTSVRAPELVTVGAACPDHLVHTKMLPMWVPFDPSSEDAAVLIDRVKERAAAYREQYAAYHAANAENPDVRMPGTEAGAVPISDPDPRVVLIQHVGLVGVAPTPKGASLSRDLYHRAIEVMAGADAVDEFVSLTADESFAVEYWPLELYKLSLAPAPGELQGKVAFVTGAGGGIGRAISAQLTAAGAVVAGFDLDEGGATEAALPLGIGIGGDVTSEESVANAYREAVRTFGGVDILVSNAGIASSSAIEDTTLEEWERNHRILGTGYFLVSKEAFRIMREQGTGGSIVFISSKNSLVAGKNASAYSSAKAAELHLARCLAEEGGADGIRVNTVNPDAVLRGSKIWQGNWRDERAANYGLDPAELEEHYRQRNTLKVLILPEDIAASTLHFASEARSGKSTGTILNVDGGVPAAYTR